ncbi:MAG: hypothetical protein HY782_11335 [Chloroflexi bacterium]|nr:hypothetical protein [Chloroflexota bacterium]
MALKLQGTVTVDATREEVWQVFFDVEALKQILNKIPGITVERFVQVAEDKYEATATMGVAMIKGKYDGTIIVLEKRAPEYVKFRGDGKGGGNWTSGEMELTLTDQGDQTTLAYLGTGNVGGALSSVGQRLIDSVGKQFIQNGTKALAEDLSARSRAKRGDAGRSAEQNMRPPS